MSANNVERDCRMMLQEMGLSGPCQGSPNTLEQERRVFLNLGQNPSEAETQG